MVFLKWLDMVERYIVAILSAALTLVVFFQILNRIFFKLNIIWPEESARYMMVWMVFMASVLAFKRGANIGIDMITSRIKGTPAKMFLVFQSVVIIAFAAMVGYFALPIIEMQFELSQTSPALKLNIAWVYLAIPVWGALTIVEIGAALLQSLRAQKEKEKAWS